MSGRKKSVAKICYNNYIARYEHLLVSDFFSRWSIHMNILQGRFVYALLSCSHSLEFPMIMGVWSKSLLLFIFDGYCSINLIRNINKDDICSVSLWKFTDSFVYYEQQITIQGK